MTFLEMTAQAIAPAKVVPVGLDRADEALELESLVWSERFTARQAEAFRTKLDFDRTFGVEAPTTGGPVLAALASAWGFDTSVPGGRAFAGGLSNVGVRPGFRRRGFLRALMAAHFEDCLNRGEPMSMLFASEAPIYGRFGYGQAGRAAALSIPKGAALRAVDFGAAGQVDIAVETADYSSHCGVVEEVNRAAGFGAAARPGWTAAVTEGARQASFLDQSPADGLAEPSRILIARRAGHAVGYALFRRDGKWDGSVPSATLEISEFEAADGGGAYAMWAELLSADLVKTIQTPRLPLDDPLFAWLEDWRVARPRLSDHEYVRLLRVGAALEARRYAAPLELRLAVRDQQYQHNTGVWRLSGGPDGASAERISSNADEPSDLTLGVRELGALYLGGVGAAFLSDAGLIRESTPGAALVLGRAFRGDRQPFTPHSF
ncbi:MAG: GNAT family N-acetyltransferase [Propionibacteriaceae bacterium]|jgi:predicted acetyltransferase|nr:GNAT family N-acetyltransferase [Propionibacteriaceae bacterium]